MIIDLGKTVIAENYAYRDIFEEGRFPGPSIHYRWPINIAADQLARAFVRPIGWLIPGPREVPPSNSIVAACAAIADRWSKLVSLLREGSILCAGFYRRTGVNDILNKTHWSRSGLSVDIRNSDLFDKGDKEPSWQDLTLTLPEMAPRVRESRSG